MEKVRNFVVKYQVWFKLAAIAIIIAAIFSPLYSRSVYPPFLFNKLFYYLEILIEKRDFLFLFVVIFLSISSISLLLSFFIKQFNFISSISYNLMMIFLFIFIFTDYSVKPRIGFYLFTFLFILNIIFTIVYFQQNIKCNFHNKQFENKRDDK